MSEEHFRQDAFVHATGGQRLVRRQDDKWFARNAAGIAVTCDTYHQACGFAGLRPSPGFDADGRQGSEQSMILGDLPDGVTP